MENKELRVLEFYSGIGGMHYSLIEAGVPFQVLQSYDINTNAILNYKHTFKKQTNQKNIESLSVEELSAYKSNAWLMSPPCQPFTRQGLQKDDQDNRTNSFFHLLDIMKQMQTPPEYILIENVFGFESSNTRDTLIETLKLLNYSFQEFHLSPQSFGLPNQRLRYFCIAKRSGTIFTGDDLIKYKDQVLLDHIPGYTHTKSMEECNAISYYLDSNLSEKESLEKYGVPNDLLLSKGMLFDIKTIDQKTSNCFTRSYGKFVEGTGSILQLDQSKSAIADDPQSLLNLKLRYFSPKEITRLHGFPESFTFSPNFSNVQCFRLIGNSLNVKIVSELIKLLYSK
ncbi:hypothetical protein CYY_007994 [Polysphondylium violaceum]|uniref:Uncharacterized protein n=1 Tax=Polysphondylium violaceum TaxID=133409 RepID=A0A8J4UXN3_9MYCE|nr:hypothetical protein CYY_007994 [Polysphondylium violaceum]